MKSWCSIIAAALCCLLFASTTEAATIYGCVRKAGGYLRIVDRPSRCRASETPISFNQEGPPGPKGDAGAPGIRGAQGLPGASLLLLDAAGNQLCVLADFDTTYGTRCFVPEVGRFVFFSVSNATPEYSTIFFTTADCTGQPYMYEASRYNAVVNDGKWYATTSQVVAAESTWMLSSRDAGPGIGAGDCYTIIRPSYGAVLPALEITMPFPLPIQSPIQIVIQ